MIFVDTRQQSRVISIYMSRQYICSRNIPALTVINSSHFSVISGHISSQSTMKKDILVVSVIIKQHRREISRHTRSQFTRA